MKQLILVLTMSIFSINTISAQEDKSTKEARLQAVLNKVTDQKKVFGTSFTIRHGDFNWSGVSGNFSKGQPYFIASTTKLFTTAIVLNLRAQGKLNLEDKIGLYIDSAVLRGLHVYKGRDYSAEITVRQLLAHTSGLPDYFQGKGEGGKSLEEELVAGNNQFWTFEQAMDRTRNMKPLFAPGTKGKAQYSDANFQLLGRIIENITGISYEQNCVQMIIGPLQLKNTYLYVDHTDIRPQNLYFKSNPLLIPKAMTSFGPDGGMVSNSEDMLMFVEAFFTGKLFPVSYIGELQQWNSIFFPMKAGVGIHLFKLPRIFDITGSIPYFIGHSGLSGALAYYSPKENLFIAGTVNQVAHPDLSFKTMIKLWQVVK